MSLQQSRYSAEETAQRGAMTAAEIEHYIEEHAEDLD